MALRREAVVPMAKIATSSRRHNKSLILEAILMKEPISRADLGRMTRLSMPAVMSIVSELTEEGLLREVGRGPSSGGRPPVLLELIPKARSAVGLEVGTRTLTAVFTDLKADVKVCLKVPSEMSRGPQALEGQVIEILGQIIKEKPDGLEGPMGIGLAVPAPVLSTDKVFSPPSYPGWGESRLGTVVADTYGLPVLVDNDANAAALGESLFGVARGVRDMLYIIVHRGVGGALLLNGELYRGADGGAGEIGHTLIDLDGPRCGCGRYGCLEAFVGRAALARRAREKLKLIGKEMTEHDPDSVTAKDVIDAGLRGDEVARALLGETGEYLGIGIANMIHAFNPSLVVLGGSTMRAGDLILDSAIRVLRRRALPGLDEGTRVVPGELGEDAAAVGAAALVLCELFTMPRRNRT